MNLSPCRHRSNGSAWKRTGCSPSPGEFAAIVADSMTGELVATRSATDVRTVRFAIEDETSATTVDIELEVDEELAGSIEPRCDEIAIVTADDRTIVSVNARGFFRSELPTAPFRIECVVDGVACSHGDGGALELARVGRERSSRTAQLLGLPPDLIVGTRTHGSRQSTIREALAGKSVRSSMRSAATGPCTCSDSWSRVMTATVSSLSGIGSAVPITTSMPAASSADAIPRLCNPMRSPRADSHEAMTATRGWRDSASSSCSDRSPSAN
ncbi:hypothetical protein GQR58_029612 [Nymphon striatum]|nr:hypothetical protein GQR58_029612 [Nymphon striatum]